MTDLQVKYPKWLVELQGPCLKLVNPKSQPVQINTLETLTSISNYEGVQTMIP